jgi:hypothetical protein
MDNRVIKDEREIIFNERSAYSRVQNQRQQVNQSLLIVEIQFVFKFVLHILVVSLGAKRSNPYFFYDLGVCFVPPLLAMTIFKIFSAISFPASGFPSAMLFVCISRRNGSLNNTPFI